MLLKSVPLSFAVIFHLRTSGLMFLLLTVVFSVSAQPVCINTFPYFQDFENGAGGWAASAGGTSGWTLGTPNKPVINSAYSGTKAWVTGTVTGNYANNFNAYVQSPCFDFSGIVSPLFTMKAWWESEFSWDGANIQVSTNGGATFQVVGGYQNPINWYTDNTINSLPGGSQLGWTGRQVTGNGSNGWKTVQHRLNGMGGQPSVIIRIYFASDNSANFDGFAFDNIAIRDEPIINLGADTTICFADTLILDATYFANASYKWRNNFTLPNPQDTLQTLPVYQSGIYFVEVIDPLGFIIRDTMRLVVSNTFVNLGVDRLICPGDTLLLNAFNASANHLWLPGNITSQTLPVFASGTYTVIVSDSVGCVEVDSINVAVDFVPVVDLGPDTTICVGESIILDAGTGTPGTQYGWNFGASTQTVFVSAPGQYSVLVTTAANCTATDTMNLNVVLSPVVNLGPNRIECGTFTLNANNPGSTFLWSTGATSQTITSATPGTFWVNVTNPFGCSARDTVAISSGAVPAVNLGADKVVCNGSSVTLNAGNPGLSYFWSNGSTSQTITVSQPGQYFVSVTNADGCVGRDTVAVILSPLTVELGPNRTICEGLPFVLDAGSNGAAYIWSNGATTPTISVTTGGLYSVTVTDAAGCVASDNIVLTSQPNFTADFEMVPDTAVLYQVLQFNDLSTGNPTSWFWRFGDGNTSTLQNPTHSYVSLGVFSVILTVSDGVCTNRDTLRVRVDIFAELDEELAGMELNVYPNPNNGRFTVDIEMENPKELRMELYDLSGRKWHETTLSPAWSHSRQIHLDHAPAGLYLLRLSTDEGETYRKIQIH